jgi:CHAT domain-containing protein
MHGHHLAERHTLINLLSFPANPGPGGRLQATTLQPVFLAGHPRDFTSNPADQLDTSPEIRAMADIFVGPGLQIIQGTALLPDEFRDEYFRRAMLVHSTMPAVIDLGYPRKSSLELSGAENRPGHESLRPVDIRSQELDARLVFLGSSRWINEPLSGFSTWPGLVADFLTAGASSVIANTWANSGQTDVTFKTDFYRELEVSGDIAKSLRDAKLQYLKHHRDDGLYDWAGYQLFID